MTAIWQITTDQKQMSQQGQNFEGPKPLLAHHSTVTLKRLSFLSIILTKWISQKGLRHA